MDQINPSEIIPKKILRENISESNLYKIKLDHREDAKESKIVPESYIDTKISLESDKKPNLFDLIVPELKNQFKSPLELDFNQPTEVEDYQKDVLMHVVEFPEVTDFVTAYRRLNTESNRAWKINPSEIADFYLLEAFKAKYLGGEGYNEDSRYLALMKADEKIGQIGKRLLVALVHEQLEEYDRFANVNANKLTEGLRGKIAAYFGDNNQLTRAIISEDSINGYLTRFKKKLDAANTPDKQLEILKDNQFGVVLEILENQQHDRWKTMATAMRALYDKTLPIENVVSGLGFKPDEEALKRLDKNRQDFLIDRLINYIHQTGRMSARVCNYFPKAASILVAHGMPGMEQYLLFNSGLIEGVDSLSAQVKKEFGGNKDTDIVERFAAILRSGKIPREYEYGLALEIDDPRILDAVEEKRMGKLSPSEAYYLLSRVTQHDGVSKGRLGIIF